MQGGLAPFTTPVVDSEVKERRPNLPETRIHSYLLQRCAEVLNQRRLALDEHVETTKGSIFPNTAVIYDSDGDSVWFGSGAVICPGVTIGENAVIGAGRIVTKDIPANVIAAGNPCKVLREINEQDKLYYYKDFLAFSLL